MLYVVRFNPVNLEMLNISKFKNMKNKTLNLNIETNIDHERIYEHYKYLSIYRKFTNKSK